MSGSSARRFTEKDLHNGNDHHDHKKDDWNEGERDGSPAALGRSRTSEQEANAARLRVTMTISFHITVALATTLLNKWALNLVPMPDVLLSMQMGLCVIFSWWIWAFNLGDVGSLMLSWEEVRTMWKYLGMRTIGVGMKVWCLNYVQASFYQASRGLLLPVTVLFSYFLLNSRPSREVLGYVGIICVGFTVGALAKGSQKSQGASTGEGFNLMAIAFALTDIGIILGIVSTLTTALETIVVKWYGPKLTVFRAVYITSLVGTAVFTIISIFSGEAAQFRDLVSTVRIQGFATGHPTRATSVGEIWSAILISGTAYYLVSLAAVLQITVTSPVTHTISTAVRGVLQSLMACLLLPGEWLTMGEIVSIIIILIGSGGYTWSKEKQLRLSQAEKMHMASKA